MARKTVKHICLQCGVEFDILKTWSKHGRGKFCSIKCSSIGRIKKQPQLVQLTCSICGRKFNVRKHRKDTAKYCSTECMYKRPYSRKYEDWQYIRTKSNRLKLMYDNCPKCDDKKSIGSATCRSCSFKSDEEYAIYILGKSNIDNKYKPQHKVIAENILGRLLKHDEVVHHINMDKKDNRNSNLLVCTKKYHMQLHQKYAKRFAELHMQ